MIKNLLLAITAVAISHVCLAQQATGTGEKETLPKWNIKTNLLYDATATINLGVEFQTGARTSFDLSGSYNPWTFDNNKKWKYILAQPEFRLWTRETFRGSFFGLHAHYAYYNVGGLSNPPFSAYMNEHRFQGWLVGAGIGYGYRWNFGQSRAQGSRWAMEAEIGVGYAYLSYDKYPCDHCGEKIGSDTKNYFGPTKASVSLIYSFGAKKRSVQQPVPVYIVPKVEAKPVVVPVAEPVVQPQPIVEDAPVKKPTSGDKLAQTHPFIVPYSQFKPIAPGQLSDADYEDAVTIYFRQGKFAIDRTLDPNEQSLSELLSAIRTIELSHDSRIEAVIIAGFASPEGPYSLNERLAGSRAEVIKKYIIENSSLKSENIILYNGTENWKGLEKMVEASDMPSKEKVLQIIVTPPIRDTASSTGREKSLMKLDGGRPYKYMLENFYPKLRNAACIKVYYRNK